MGVVGRCEAKVRNRRRERHSSSAKTQIRRANGDCIESPMMKAKKPADCYRPAITNLLAERMRLINDALASNGGSSILVPALVRAPTSGGRQFCFKSAATLLRYC